MDNGQWAIGNRQWAIGQSVKSVLIREIRGLLIHEIPTYDSSQFYTFQFPISM